MGLSSHTVIHMAQDHKFFIASPYSTLDAQFNSKIPSKLECLHNVIWYNALNLTQVRKSCILAQIQFVAEDSEEKGIQLTERATDQSRDWYFKARTQDCPRIIEPSQVLRVEERTIASHVKKSEKTGMTEGK